MTKRCFSSSQLYAMRNEINIEMLIEKTLGIPSQVTKGCFRFLCPLCNGFDTAVNPKTNLARCFRCEKNFNTIDLVMLIRKTNFVQSVKFLQSIHHKDPHCQDPSDAATISGSSPQGGCRIKFKTPPAKSDSDPCRIGKILDNVLPVKHSGAPEKDDAGYKSNEPAISHQNYDEDRIAKLEQQLQYLSRQIEKLAQMINVGNPSK
jgi:hypothetical protein